MKLKLLLLILLFVLGIQTGSAQNSIDEFSKQIEILYQKGDKKQSEKVFQEKTSLLKTQDNLEEYLYAYWDYYMLNPAKKRLNLLEDSITNLWRQPQTEEEHLAYIHLLINHAFHLKKYGSIYRSITSYEKALGYFDIHQPAYHILDFCIKPLANNYTRIGDYQRADDLMMRGLQMATATKNYKQIISFSNNLAISKQSQGKYNLAINILNKALQTPSSSKIQKSRLHSELARNWFKKQNYQEAIKEAEKAFVYQSKVKNKNQHILINCHTTKSMCFIALKKHKKASKEINKALQLASKTYQSNDREIAKLYLLAAEIESAKRNYNNALSKCQKSLQTLLPEYEPKHIFDNPNSDLFYPENTIKEALDTRARIFTLQKDYVNALKNYHLSFIQEDLLRFTYSSQESKIIQQTENRNRSIRVIDLCHKLYEKTNDKLYILKAFNYAEKTKSLVLLDEFQNKKNENTHKTDSLFSKQKVLQFQKASVSKELQLAIHNKVSQEILTKYSNKRSELANQLQLIKNEIQNKYAFSNSYAELNLQAIQKYIGKEEKLLIEYFVGASYTTIFKIDAKKGLSWRKISNDNYFSLLAAFFLFFSEDNGSKITNEIDNYKELAQAIYQQVVAQELKEVNSKKLLIIPDGILSFIPFDALLTRESRSRNFQKMPFLVKEKEVSYGYSLTILSNIKTNKSFNQELVGFFPEFIDRQRGLSQLPYTQEERQNISSHLPIIFYDKEKATKEKFIQNSKQSRIIHLSTHANTKNKDKLSAIEFWDESLYLTELYGYEINADLVVLSACETGLGQVQKGEGAMSLARGFSYAGVSNLVVSLWKVNDKATSILMGDFYKFLSKNRTATEALHESKLSYLNNKEISNTKKSPYYWASFIPIKNTSKVFTIDSETSSWPIYLLVVLLIGLFVSIFKITRFFLKPVPALPAGRFARNETNS